MEHNKTVNVESFHDGKNYTNTINITSKKQSSRALKRVTPVDKGHQFHSKFEIMKHSSKLKVTADQRCIKFSFQKEHALPVVIQKFNGD